MTPLKLIALAHAGGSAAALVHLRQHLPSSIALRSVELPGHGARFSEPLIASRKRLIAQLAEELAAELHGPYALFGHSLGGMLAFELAHALKARGCGSPRALCVAAAAAPCSQKRRRPEAWQSDAAIEEVLRNLGGTPPELFQHRELLDLFIPLVRADFQLCDDVPEPTLPPLAARIHVYAGTQDELAPQALEGWRRATTRRSTLHWFEGDHFFVRSQAAALCSLIAEQLTSLDAPARPPLWPQIEP